MNIARAYKKYSKNLSDLTRDCMNDTQLVHARDSAGESLLFEAVRQRNMKMIQILLDHGAYLLLTDTEGVTPLFLASIKKDSELFQYCLARAKSYLIEDEIALLYAQAATKGDTDKILDIIQAGHPCNVTWRDTPILYWAVQSEQVSVFELLVSNGAEVNTQNDNGMTALYTAAANGQLAIMEFLINHGADINLSSDSGVSPLAIASCFGQLDAVRCLLKYGANLELADEDGLTPLLEAILYSYDDIVAVLLEYGAKADVKDVKGRGIEYYLKKCKAKWRPKMLEVLKAYGAMTD